MKLLFLAAIVCLVTSVWAPMPTVAQASGVYGSPDNAWVASTRYDAGSQTQEICLGETADDEVVCQVSPLPEAGKFQYVAFAPDSRLIATRFDNGIPCVWSVPSLDSWCLDEWESSFLFRAMTGQWAPDSSAFAFAHFTGEGNHGDHDLVVVEVGTRSGVNVTDDGVDTLEPPPDRAVPLDGGAVWSPESDQLLVQRRRWIPETAPERWDYSLIVMDRDGGNLTTIHSFDGTEPWWGNTFWTTDGWILYSERAAGGLFDSPASEALRQVRPDGSEDGPIVDTMPLDEPGIECISSDGRYLLVEEYFRGDGTLPWRYGVIDRTERTFTELGLDANGDPAGAPCVPPQSE